MPKQCKQLWTVEYEFTRKGRKKKKNGSVGENLWILAPNLIDALTKGQRFLDEKFGDGMAKTTAGEDSGTIDAF